MTKPGFNEWRSQPKFQQAHYEKVKPILSTMTYWLSLLIGQKNMSSGVHHCQKASQSQTHHWMQNFYSIIGW